VARLDAVQRDAARMAYALDERAGSNIVAIGVGLVVFWPALLAMRSTESHAQQLAALKGEHAALLQAATAKGCDLQAPSDLATWPVSPGDTLVYEDGPDPITQASRRHTLVLSGIDRQTLRLSGVAFGGHPAVADLSASWVMDRLGNLMQAGQGPVWPQLLREPLDLGGVVAGVMADALDPRQQARLRGQVVAIGPQRIAERDFDVAVIELFGDAQDDGISHRLEGALAVDRRTGLLLRMDLHSRHPSFQLQRRLLRITAP
jgi:hypothetical protein